MSEQTDFDAYEVTCARCGKVGLCTEFIIEEGDEWECPACWERCERQEREQAKRGIRGALDKLIDHYEQHKPADAMRIQVSATRATLRRFAKCEKRGGPLMYRGREVVPVGSKRKRGGEARA